ncbi:S8 family serine peptidase [Haloferula sp.]|uniref:S8 family serine peptidase n=1 Tax=Haloferula sp. TaxID=2497595 RepID=UPI00329B83D0
MNKSALNADEVALVPNGDISIATWAQARLNDGNSPSSGPLSYTYPDTNTAVRLYLIDSSVANPGNWFDANANLTIDSPILVGTTSPGENRTSVHATRMLSLIAGPETGAALGTDIQVVNFDIYPDGEDGIAVASHLTQAIYDAIDHHEDAEDAADWKPGVICIAAGSEVPASSNTLEDAVLEARDAGLTVIVSAGNEADDASLYVPSAYGSNDGVICIGASSKANGIWTDSNYGSAVDFYAPGEDVPTLVLPTPSSGATDDMDGSSPATALATATALVTLSMHPDFTPAELENHLKGSDFTGIGGIQLVQLSATDFDGDGVHNMLEEFAGSDSLDAMDTPSRPSVSGISNPDGNTAVSIGFSIDADLFDSENPSQLLDGVTWKVKESTNLSDWNDSTGAFVYGTATDGKIPVTFTRTGTESCCFLKLEVTPAP